MAHSLKGVVVPVTAFQQNCTILFDQETRAGIVIDPGGDIETIITAAQKEGVTLEAIWLTHGHIDHAAGAMDLKDRLDIKILGPHIDDTPLLQALQQQAGMFGLTDQVRNVTPDTWLNDGDEVSFAGHIFRVLHCPGHAPGHVIFVNDAHKFAHLGDVLFRGSIGRTDLPGGNHATLLKSIAKKVLPLGDDVTFICGHGPGSSIGEERRTNPFLVGQV
ncbi:MAG: MBL fold metallo-hydrolase [Pseudomonadota bacterium]